MFPVIRGDPYRPQVSVPLISRPVTCYRKGRTTPLWGVWWLISFISQFLIRLLVVT